MLFTLNLLKKDNNIKGNTSENCTQQQKGNENVVVMHSDKMKVGKYGKCISLWFTSELMLFN